jgi:hypothetical protein
MCGTESSSLPLKSKDFYSIYFLFILIEHWLYHFGKFTNGFFHYNTSRRHTSCKIRRPVPGLLDKKGGRRCHLLLNKRLHLLPSFLSDEPGTGEEHAIFLK